MVLLKRFICGSNLAVADYDPQPEKAREPFKPTISCINASSMVDYSAYVFPSKLSLMDLMGELDTINESESEYNSQYGSECDYYESEYEEEEVESDTEYEYYEEEVEDEYYYEEVEVEDEAPDEGVNSTYNFAELLGKKLVSKTSRRPVNTDDVLCDSSIVAIYYTPTPECQATTERLSVFAAGYDEKSFSVVYCSNSKPRRFRAPKGGFATMPLNWLAMPASANKAKRALVKALNLDANKSCLIVLDASSGTVLSRNALDEIAHLDPESQEYDAEAHHVFEGWISSAGLQQDVIGEKEIEFGQSA